MSHNWPFSANWTFPGSGRSFTATNDADYGRSIARVSARLLSFAYGDAATHNRFPA